MKKIIAEFNHVTKKYNQTIASDDLTFTICQGEAVTILGKSGSGKSTLLSLAAGFINADEGEIKVDGKHLSTLSPKERTKFRRRSIGMVFQFFNLMESLTVYENIILPVHLDHQAVDESYTHFLMDTLDITELKDRSIHECSGGQKQRIAIARALINRPAILLADEPTGNLDSVNIENVITLLKKLRKTMNLTMLIVTHDAKTAQIGSRVLELKDGRIITDTQNETA